MLKLNNTCTAHPNVTMLLEKKVYARRKERKISQDHLADNTGLTRNCIQQMECHEHLPKLLTLLKIMAALEFDRDEFSIFMLELWDAYLQDLQLQEEQIEALTLVSP